MGLGREYIVENLQKLGLSRRRATYILNEVIESMKQALSKGESIELPIGTLEVVKRNSPHRGWHLGRILTTYKEGYTVLLKPRGKLSDL